MFQVHKTSSSGKEDFEGLFYHIWAWQLSWSCDLDKLSKVSKLYSFVVYLYVNGSGSITTVGEES